MIQRNELDDSRREGLGELLRARADRVPRKTFVTALPGGSALTYGEAFQKMAHLGDAVAAASDLAEGDHVAIYHPDLDAKVIAWLAIASKGMVDVPIDPDYVGDLLVTLLRKSNARAVLTDAAGAQRVEMACQSNPCLIERAEVDGLYLLRLDSFSNEQKMAVGSGQSKPSSIRFTSGSTGLPKAVMLSRAHVLRKGQQFCRVMRFGETDTIYTPFPLHHSLASFGGVVATLVAGGSIALRTRFSASHYWDDAISVGATLGQILDAPMRFLLAQPPRDTDRGHNMRAAWTALSSTEAFESRFGVQVAHLYNMSELNVVADRVLGSGPCDHGAGTCCGPISDRYRVAVTDNGKIPERVEPGAEGELAIRPEHADDMFLGYFGDWLETTERWRDLWFRTGDIGLITETGCLHITGRVSGRIRRHGVNISSEAIVGAAEKIDGVVEGAVVTVPDDDGGEDEIKLYVLTSSPSSITAPAIAAQLREVLPKSYLPRYLELMDSFPRTATGKLDTERIRKLATVRTGRCWDDVNGGYLSDVGGTAPAANS